MKRSYGVATINRRFGYEDEHEEPIPKSDSVVRLGRPKPPTSYYHYSNDDSQGALICQTQGFPGWFDKNKQSYHCAYSDRIGEWDYERLQRASKIAGGGSQAWAYRLPSLSDEQLKEFAQVALDLPCTPEHVRIVHHFNVATGYSCPTVEAIL